MAKRILVPISRADDSGVVAVAGAVAREQGSTVRLLRIHPMPERVVDLHNRTLAYADQEMDRLTAASRSDFALAESQLAGVPVETVVRFGDPVEEILHEAEGFEADLIAMTTPRRSRLGSALTPAVSERVLREATVPVLVVRN
jgi:nucleotide-binding universal stress UspA family protein